MGPRGWPSHPEWIRNLGTLGDDALLIIVFQHWPGLLLECKLPSGFPVSYVEPDGYVLPISASRLKTAQVLLT